MALESLFFPNSPFLLMKKLFHSTNFHNFSPALLLHKLFFLGGAATVARRRWSQRRPAAEGKAA